MKNKSFHNTLELSGKKLADAEAAASTQEEKVLLFFMARPHGAFSPSRVHKMLVRSKQINERTPVTSIRRAITNLTNDGKLAQTEHMVEGPMGKPEHTWKISASKKIRNMPIQKSLF